MPLTVVQLLPRLDSGGVERGTLEVGDALTRRGHVSIVISGGGRLVRSLEGAGTEHITWPVGKKTLATLRYVIRLRQFLCERRVDVLHARSRVPAWVAWLAWRGLPPATRPRFVTTVHGLYSVNAYSAIMTRGERVIAVSDTVRRYIVENYPRTDPDRISVIPRGVDETAFPYGYRPDPVIRHQLAGDRVGPLLTLPGRLTRLKGHLDFCELLRRLPHAVGVIVGDEDPRRRGYADELRRVAPSNVVFAGHRSDMRDVLATSTIVLSLSRQPESFGRTTLEALSLGVPVIGYDHGGVGELLAELCPAGRVPVGDLDRLTDCVRAFLAAPPVVPHPHRFTLRRMLEQELALYERLCEQEPVRQESAAQII